MKRNLLFVSLVAAILFALSSCHVVVEFDDFESTDTNEFTKNDGDNTHNSNMGNASGSGNTVDGNTSDGNTSGSTSGNTSDGNTSDGNTSGSTSGNTSGSTSGNASGSTSGNASGSGYSLEDTINSIRVVVSISGMTGGEDALRMYFQDKNTWSSSESVAVGVTSDGDYVLELSGLNSKLNFDEDSKPSINLYVKSLSPSYSGNPVITLKEFYINDAQISVKPGSVGYLSNGGFDFNILNPWSGENRLDFSANTGSSGGNTSSGNTSSGNTSSGNTSSGNTSSGNASESAVLEDVLESYAAEIGSSSGYGDISVRFKITGITGGSDKVVLSYVRRDGWSVTYSDPVTINCDGIYEVSLNNVNLTDIFASQRSDCFEPVNALGVISESGDSNTFTGDDITIELLEVKIQNRSVAIVPEKRFTHMRSGTHPSNVNSQQFIQTTVFSPWVNENDPADNRIAIKTR